MSPSDACRARRRRAAHGRSAARPADAGARAAAWAGRVGRRRCSPVRLLVALLLGLGACLVLLAPARGRPGDAAPTAAALLLVLAARRRRPWSAGSRSAHNPVAALARDGAVVRVEATVTSDPRPVTGPVRRAGAGPAHGAPGDRARAHLRAGHAGAGPGRRRMAGLRLGERRCGPPGGSRLPRDPTWPRCCTRAARRRPVARPDAWWRAAGAVRPSLRASVVAPAGRAAGAGARAGRRRRRRASTRTWPTTSAPPA